MHLLIVTTACQPIFNQLPTSIQFSTHLPTKLAYVLPPLSRFFSSAIWIAIYDPLSCISWVFVQVPTMSPPDGSRSQSRFPCLLNPISGTLWSHLRSTLELDRLLEDLWLSPMKWNAQLIESLGHKRHKPKNISNRTSEPCPTAAHMLPTNAIYNQERCPRLICQP